MNRNTLHSRLLAAWLLLMPLAAMIDGLAVLPLALALFLLMAWNHRALADIPPAQWKSGVAIVALLSLWPALTSLWSITPHASLMTALKAAALLLMLPSASMLADGRSYPRAVWSMPALGIAVAALMILSAKLPGGGALGAIGTLLHGAHSNYLDKDVNRGLCALAVLVWPATAGLLGIGRRRMALALPWLLLPALLFMHSLSAKTGMLAGMLAFYATMRWPQSSRTLLLCGIPVIFIAWPPLFYLFEPELRDHLYAQLPPSSQHRIEIWHFVLDLWQEKPLLGWGADSSRAIPGGLVEIRPGMALLPLHPHNLPLHVLLEQGIIGFGLFLAALCLILRRALAQPHPAIAAALAAYATIGLTAFGMWQAWWIATALAAYLLLRFFPDGFSTG